MPSILISMLRFVIPLFRPVNLQNKVQNNHHEGASMSYQQCKLVLCKAVKEHVLLLQFILYKKNNLHLRSKFIIQTIFYKCILRELSLTSGKETGNKLFSASSLLNANLQVQSKFVIDGLTAQKKSNQQTMLLVIQQA